MRTCQKCGAEYRLLPAKPGLIGECPTCGRQNKREPRHAIAKIAWSGKHTPEIEIILDPSPYQIRQAETFNRMQRRAGAGPVAAFGNSAATTQVNAENRGWRDGD